MPAGPTKMRAMAKILTGLAEVLPVVLCDEYTTDMSTRHMTVSELNLLISLIRDEDTSGWTLLHLADIASVSGATKRVLDETQSVPSQPPLPIAPPGKETMELRSGAEPTCNHDIVPKSGETPGLAKEPLGTTRAQACCVGETQTLRSQPAENEKLAFTSEVELATSDRKTPNPNGLPRSDHNSVSGSKVASPSHNHMTEVTATVHDQNISQTSERRQTNVDKSSVKFKSPSLAIRDNAQEVAEVNDDADDAYTDQDCLRVRVAPLTAQGPPTSAAFSGPWLSM